MRCNVQFSFVLYLCHRIFRATSHNIVRKAHKHPPVPSVRIISTNSQTGARRVVCELRARSTLDFVTIMLKLLYFPFVTQVRCVDSDILWFKHNIL